MMASRVLIGDADILIAASALTQELGVATNNESHFRRIPGLHLENWLT
jgi:tRNA(fMet)-specific endonuclease VapC